MIYLDHFATTPLDARVLKVMLPYMKSMYGNPSSQTHKFGWDAQEAVDDARSKVAKLIGCDYHQIIFTSGATESNNTVLKQGFNSITTSRIEHSSIIHICNNIDAKINWLGCNENGLLDLDIGTSDLVSVMMVNNEIGTIQEIERLDILRQKNTLIHSDMTQALGKVDIDVKKLNVDFASFSAHKIYGPKGIGALYFKNSLKPLIHGGSQEFGLRAGTLNVSAIVGFGEACSLLYNNSTEERKTLKERTEMFFEELQKKIPGVVRFKFAPQVAGALNIMFPCKNVPLMLNLLGEEVAISTSSACTSGPSRVLKVVGLDDEEIEKSVRICIGRFNSIEELKQAVYLINEAFKQTEMEEV